MPTPTDGMSSGLDYGRFVQNAMRRVVHDALQHVAEHGFPGQHHFYITFTTTHPGVVIPDSLSHRYPDEMTIVLQHEFWALDVESDRFGVTLSFSNIPHRLEIPFEAVTVFADPTVSFGLQFGAESAAADDPDGPTEEPAEASAAVHTLEGTASEAKGSEDTGGAEVVTLDRFRRK